MWRLVPRSLRLSPSFILPQHINYHLGYATSADAWFTDARATRLGQLVTLSNVVYLPDAVQAGSSVYAGGLMRTKLKEEPPNTKSAPRVSINQ